jgi:membrane protein YdbS with pleckstrin-like domain
MPCPTCGAESVETATFCHQCGARLASAAEPAAHAATRVRAATDIPEEPLWEGSFSAKAMVGYWCLAAVLSVAAVVAAVVWSDWWWAFLGGAVALWAGLGLMLLYNQLSVRYRLTNQRFFHERGILRRVTNRIDVLEIDDVTFEQGPVERFLGTGLLIVFSSDRTNPKLYMPGIDRVQDVAALIDQARRAERVRRGLMLKEVGVDQHDHG